MSPPPLFLFLFSLLIISLPFPIPLPFYLLFTLSPSISFPILHTRLVLIFPNLFIHVPSIASLSPSPPLYPSTFPLYIPPHLFLFIFPSPLFPLPSIPPSPLPSVPPFPLYPCFHPPLFPSLYPCISPSFPSVPATLHFSSLSSIPPFPLPSSVSTSPLLVPPPPPAVFPCLLALQRRDEIGTARRDGGGGVG